VSGIIHHLAFQTGHKISKIRYVSILRWNCGEAFSQLHSQ